MIYVAVVTLTIALAALGWKYVQAQIALKKYRPLLDLDREIHLKMKQTESQRALVQQLETTLTQLRAEADVLTDAAELSSAGFYKSKYNFDHSRDFEARLDQLRAKQKQRIKDKTALICTTEWTVEGSKAKGKQMTERIIKLGLSAFNVQCDNEILKVKFDNIDRAEDRLTKIRESVDKLLEPNRCHITQDFFKMKLEELQLVYEYQEKVHREKEEQREIREQMRDEERARRELERVEQDAEREERRYQDALDKARRELDKKKDSDRAAFLLKIQDLESKLAEASVNRERAKSQAELTRRGHVYVISNLGSFGEDVFKIGMTRRLDPMDRVWELSDASVPFDFDVHAMIYSEDAPALEKKLHAYFDQRRVNKVNHRKEYFRVQISEIEGACRVHHGGELKLTLLAEAKEYRQSINAFATGEAVKSAA